MINVNSIQSLGAVDGPGVRFVVFLQGCNFKCRYCHNPETIENKESVLISAEDLFDKISRYKNYIVKDGGVTFTGGEPLLQADKLIGICRLLKEHGYHIALDTNGSILNDSVKEFLSYVDLVLLDLKMPTDELYREFMGFPLKPVMTFYNYLCDIDKDMWIRQVIIEGVNDSQENIDFLKSMSSKSNVKKVELLPFKKLCITKYNNMNIPFPMENYNETKTETVQRIYNSI